MTYRRSYQPAGDFSYRDNSLIEPAYSTSKIDVAVIEALDQSIPRTIPLVEACAQVETCLVNDLSLALMRQIEAMSQNLKYGFRAITSDRFYLNDRLHEVRVVLDPLDATALHVSIMPVGVPKPGYEPASLDLALSGLGQLTRVRFWIDEDLGHLRDPLASDIDQYFAGGYRWLESHVVGELLAVEHRSTLELYMEIRSRLPQNLADLVALYGMNKEKAFYLLDSRAIQMALNRAAQHRADLASSPIGLTTLFTTQLLDPNETVAQVSLAEDRSLAVELTKSRYAQTGLNIAENAFYQTLRLDSLPLVREGRIRLTAVFPSDIRQEVEPVLKALRGRCREILARNARFSIDRIIGRGRTLNQSVTPGDVAELLGRFAAGYAESLR